MFQDIKKQLLVAGLGLVFLVIGFFPTVGLAQYDYIQNSFIVSPTKHEVRLSAGESIIRNIYITNKFDYDADFMVTVEDVSGSNTDDEVIKYYGQGLGPYSIRNYIMVENDHITIPAGQTKVVPIMISLPPKVKPGGFYGSVFVSTVNKQKVTGTAISSRVGSLIFLRVKGLAEELGEVKRFDLPSKKKIIWSRSPVNFQVVFENKGNVYLNPYGVIEIKDRNREVVDRLPIEPWFVFPDSARTRLFTWDNLPLFGYFTATLVLNHGYSIPMVTTLDYSFFVFPSLLVTGIVAIVILGVVVYKLIRKFKKWHI